MSLDPAAPLALTDASASWLPGVDIAPQVTGVDLTVRPGEHIGLVGPNGVGKSTVLALLARHLDPIGGRYEVGTQDALGCTPDDVRRLIAIVDDEPHLFAGTVRANLLLARPGASDAEVGTALVDAGLGHWLAGLPDGMDTVLGAGGRGVSGGERARIAIARAILSGRGVILLDEPTAHLDHPTATAVMRDLHDATRDAGVVVVSHQNVGTRDCDRVVALRRHAASERSTPHARERSSRTR